MHPIEHLRYVARSGSVEAQTLVNETVLALASLGTDPADLIISSRRLLQRHPSVGALWAALSRLLTAADPARAAWELVDGERVDVAAVAAHLPGDAVLVPPVEWAHEAVALAVGAVAHHGDRDDSDPAAAPVARVLDVGASDRVMRRMLRRGLDPRPVRPGGLAPVSSLLFEPLAVAPGVVVAETATVAVVSAAVDAGHGVWAVAPDAEILPTAYATEIVRRIDGGGEFGVVPGIEGVIGESGRRPLADVRVSVTPAPELLRAAT